MARSGRTLSHDSSPAHPRSPREAEARNRGTDLTRTTSRTSSASRRPLKIEIPNLLNSLRLATQKEIGLLLVYSSLVFVGFYAIAIAMPPQLSLRVWPE